MDLIQMSVILSAMHASHAGTYCRADGHFLIKILLNQDTFSAWLASVFKAILVIIIWGSGRNVFGSRKEIPQEEVAPLVRTRRHFMQVGFPERWVHQAFHNPSDSLATHSFRCEGCLSVHHSFHFRIWELKQCVLLKTLSMKLVFGWNITLWEE